MSSPVRRPRVSRIWEFPKIRGTCTLIWGPYNKEPTMWGCYTRVSCFRKPPYVPKKLRGPRPLRWQADGFMTVAGLGSALPRSNTVLAQGLAFQQQPDTAM